MDAIRYARKGDANIAYQALGDGPIDVLFHQGFGNVDLFSEAQPSREIAERFASFGRFIFFDKLGTGLSDPVPLTDLPTLEEWMDDARAVLDASGSERAAIVANFEGGPMAMLFAATYPQRTSSLVLIDTFARLARADDYPIGVPQSVLDRTLEAGMDRVTGWGTGWSAASLAPSLVGDEEWRSLAARWERASASPGTWAAITRMNQAVDVRAVLPSIHVPTLVIHRTDNFWIRVGHGRYLAENIPGARLVELPGTDTVWVGPGVGTMYDEIEEFLTGVRPEPYSERVLATVLFTDICGSTALAAEKGDKEWRQILEAHQRIVRTELASHRGREINTTGDGFLATFDGPARAILCAHSIVHRVRRLGIEVRAGLHTGECEFMREDVTGIAVDIAARIANLSEPSQVFVSRTVNDLVAGSGIVFTDRGSHTLKGVPGEWQIYSVDR